MVTIADVPQELRLKAMILLSAAELSVAEAKKRISSEDPRPPADLEKTRDMLTRTALAVNQARKCLHE